MSDLVVGDVSVVRLGSGYVLYRDERGVAGVQATACRIVGLLCVVETEAARIVFPVASLVTHHRRFD